MIENESIYDSPELRKARGAFFTPEAITKFMVDWAVRSPSDRVLEPSCGDAAFLVRAAERLQQLEEGGPKADSGKPVVSGVEIHADSAEAARKRVLAAGATPDIVTGDFFLLKPEARYDAVIGNPPFIRYHGWSGEARTRSREAALSAGVPLSGLASSWAAFTIQSSLHLKRGGRLCLVLPAELLSVNYAAPIRKFLFDRFASVSLVLFGERVFAEAETDVILLLAEGFGDGSTDHAHVVQSVDAKGLATLGVAQPWKPVDPAGKWTTSLLGREALAVYSNLLASGRFVGLKEWGQTKLGMVTGNNKFFAMTRERIISNDIPASELLRLSPPGSGHLRGLSLTASALDRLEEDGAATRLWRPSGEVSPAGLKYKRLGEQLGVNGAYKCKVRNPWWRVPLVNPADLFLTYMNADTPRITSNEAGALHLNSVHGVYLESDLRELGCSFLPLASLNSMTLLGAETVGRAYGGGMLKIEPREADLLPVPSPELVSAAKVRLETSRDEIEHALARSELLRAVEIIDDVVLIGELGMSRSEVSQLRDAHAAYSARRTARSRRVKG